MKKYSDDIGVRLSGRHKKCIQLAGNVKGKDILDIGSSFGWFEKFALEKDCRKIVGLEYDAKLLEKAKEQIRDRRAQFVRGSALELPFESDSFDQVVMFDVIEHIPKNTEIKALGEIHRVLKKGGEFYLSTPNSNLIANIFDPAWYFGHRHYSIDRLRGMLEKSGLKVEEYSYGGGWYDIMYIWMLYFFKWILKSEAPGKDFFDKKRDEEYLSKDKMFNIVFLRARKI